VAPSRFAILTRHFLRRFLDNDLISPSGDAHLGLSQVLAAFVVPGLMIVTTVMLKYSHYRLMWGEVVDLTFDDATVYVALAMILFGTASTITWDAFYLDPRDEVVLGSLPVSSRLLAGAKLAALGVFLGVFTAALNAIPVLLAPILTIRPVRMATLGQLLSLAGAQAGASVGAGVWAAGAVVALRGLLGWLLPARVFRRVGPLVQGALVLLVLGWAVSLPHFLLTARSVWEAGGWMRDLSPPFWFVGVHRYAIGQRDAASSALAGLALTALVATTAVVVLVFLAWPARRQFAGASAAYVQVNRRSLASRFIRGTSRWALPGGAVARASFEFTLLGLGRSSMHRLYLAAALGAGLAWSMGSAFWATGVRGAAAVTTPMPTMLQMQPILTLLLIVAVRFGVTVPVTLPANWLFRVTEGQPVSRYLAGIRWAAFAVGVLPVVVLVPVHALLWGWSIAAYHGLVGACYAAFIVELLFGSQTRAPFAAAYVSGSIQLKTRWLLYLFAGSVLTAGPAVLESIVLRPGWPAWSLPAILACLAGALALARRRRERHYPGLVFEDLPPDAIQTLSIFES
jgi:hypothetical protein